MVVTKQHPPYQEQALRIRTKLLYVVRGILIADAIREKMMAETITVQIRPTLDEILKRLRTCLPDLRDRYSVASLGVFGSYVHHEETIDSDLDILIAFDDAPTFFRFIDLEDELSRLLDVKVDLVMNSVLKPRIGERILSEVVMV